MSSNYGSMPPPPSGEPDSYGDSSPPQSVTNAVGLMFLIAALGVVGVVITLADKSGLRTAIHDADKSLTPKQVDDRADTAVVVAAIIAVIIVILYVLLAMQVRKGKNWARIVTYVLSGLAIIGGISTLFTPNSIVAKSLAAVELAIYLVLIYFLSIAPSSAYFQRRRARR